MKRYCTECGAKLSPGDRFCTECGATVADTGEAAPPAAPHPPRTAAPPPRAPAPEPERVEPEPPRPAAAESAPPTKKSLFGKLVKIVLVLMALSALLGIALTAISHFAQIGWSVPTLNIGAPPPPKAEGPVRVFAIGNKEAVRNAPTVASRFRTDSPILVKSIQTYHWNNSVGRTPGTIALRASDGRVYGPWPANGQPGMGGVPNAYWLVYPEIVIPPGDYEIVDSDPGSWATNASAGQRGFYEMKWQVVKQDGKP